MEARAILLGLTGRPGGPFSPLDLDPSHFLAFLEAVVTEHGGEAAESIDALYKEALPKPRTRPQSKEERAREIARFVKTHG